MAYCPCYSGQLFFTFFVYDLNLILIFLQGNMVSEESLDKVKDTVNGDLLADNVASNTTVAVPNLVTNSTSSTNNIINNNGGPLLPAPNPTTTPKRLHVSNIPFRFRDPDLRNMFGVSQIFQFI